MSNNAHELSNRLLNALDKDYNVVDMHTVSDVISTLEKINITKELLETTRLGKHVNELRRKTADPALARRAKVLVKRWRDLVIPSAVSPGHTVLSGSNRSSAERTMRRIGGTPLTSPALTRHVVSPAVSSPLPPSRPTWGGYESDSRDVILVDDDPEPIQIPDVVPQPIQPHKPLTPSKGPPSPTPLSEEKKAKRDKKLKKRRGHSRAGVGTEATAEGWPARNGSSPSPLAQPPVAATHARKNGCRPTLDPYSALVKKMPPAGVKKVKTTKELLEEIQSRGGNKQVPSPTSPGSPDVMVIEPETITVKSPLRNGEPVKEEPKPPSPLASPPPPLPPLEDERPFHECTCGDTPQDDCPAANRLQTIPLHILALHHAYLPGINGTRAPVHPHQFAVRKLTDPERPELFNSVVPLYKYSDYADDHCIKNMSRVPLCPHLPWTEFVPSPPPPPPPKTPPTPRPYPVDDEKEDENSEELIEYRDIESELTDYKEPSDRLKPTVKEEVVETKSEVKSEIKMDVSNDFSIEQQEHRTVERTKILERVKLDGRTVYEVCNNAYMSIPYDYSQCSTAPVVTLPLEETEAIDVLEEALTKSEETTVVDEMGRPERPGNFAEWHECAKLGELIALPYVVID